MKRHIYRVVTRGPEGEYRIRDYTSEEEILRRHIQVGVEDCSTDLSLRGKPVFKGLIGPMPEAGGVVRYESPDVFEEMTKEWSEVKRKRRSRTKKTLNIVG
jgi:predicted transcriptional regulator